MLQVFPSMHAAMNKDTYFYVYFHTFFSKTVPCYTEGYVENINEVTINHEILFVCTKKNFKIVPQLTLCF